MIHYIDRKKLLDVIENLPSWEVDEFEDPMIKEVPNEMVDLQEVVRCIKNTPIECVVPLTFAYWRPIDDGAGANCSHCGEYYDTGDTEDKTERFFLFAKFYKYCPNCGAKMIDSILLGGENDD